MSLNKYHILVYDDGIASLVGITVVFTALAPESRAMIFVRELESRILAGNRYAKHLVVLNIWPALRKCTILVFKTTCTLLFTRLKGGNRGNIRLQYLK